MNAFQGCSETSGRGSLPKCFSSTLLDRSKLCPFPFPRKSRGDAAPREGQGGLASSASSPERLWNGLCLKQGLLAGVCAGFVSCGSSLSLFLTLAEQAVGTEFLGQAGNSTCEAVGGVFLRAMQTSVQPCWLHIRITSQVQKAAEVQVPPQISCLMGQGIPGR